MDVCWITLGLVVVFMCLLYTWSNSTYDHWARRNVPFVKPVPFFGNMGGTVFRRASFTEHLQSLYLKLKEHKIGGIFEFRNPVMIVTDPDLLRDITVKNFDYFCDRRKIVGQETDRMFARGLPSLRGTKWRQMRNRLSPAFTTSKLRAMFPLIDKCGKQFAEFLMNRPEAETAPLEFKGAFTRFTSDVIATAAFGQECNAIEEPDNEFYKYAEGLTTFKGFRMMIIFLYMMCPKLMQFLGIPMIPSSATKFFTELVQNVKQQREENDVVRPDMIQLLMAAQKGEIKREHGDELDGGRMGEDEHAAALHKEHLASEKSDSDETMTDEDIAAQALIFFFAGFDTVATALSFLAHELAVNPEVQERLRAEIDASISSNDGKLTYESIQKMQYLDMVVSESLRKYPPAGLTDRTCVKNYKVPDSDIVIEEGTTVIIPMFPLQHDPEYFPDPERFDPDRFNEENRKNIRPYTYLPFGSGPHNCIGIRLALMEVKMCVCYILATSQLRVSAKTEIPLQLSKTTFQMTTDAGFWLCAIPRDEPSIDI
ncbi:hypothetical protein B566_EDAN011373 [Ephemera danica]|nr:hypothetical protein B566_EDAN011373 [Ephemera danica]